MIICLPLEKNNLDSLLSELFKKAKYFLFIEENYSYSKIVTAPRKKENLAFLITQNNAQVLITGNIDSQYFDFLKASGVKIYAGVFGLTAREALGRFKRQELKETGEPSGAGQGRIL